MVIKGGLVSLLRESLAMFRAYVALAHPYHAGKPCSKFASIPPSALGGDRKNRNKEKKKEKKKKLQYITEKKKNNNIK